MSKGQLRKINRGPHDGIEKNKLKSGQALS